MQVSFSWNSSDLHFSLGLGLSLVCETGGMCFLKLKPCKHIALHQMHKIMLFLALSDDPFNCAVLQEGHTRRNVGLTKEEMLPFMLMWMWIVINYDSYERSFRNNSPKNDISSFTPPHVIPNLFDWLSFMKHKEDIMHNVQSDSNHRKYKTAPEK